MPKNEEQRLETIRRCLPGPGVYELTVDVNNPRPDKRRAKYDWDAKPIIPAGTRFIIQHEDHFNNMAVFKESEVAEIMKKEHEEDPISFCSINVMLEGSRRGLTVRRKTYDRHAQIVEAMLGRLDKCEESIEYVLRTTGADGWRTPAVLRLLVKGGYITVAQLREALENDALHDDD